MQLSIYAAAATASHSRVTGFAIGLSRPDVDCVADSGSVMFPAIGRVARAAAAVAGADPRFWLILQHFRYLARRYIDRYVVIIVSVRSSLSCPLRFL
jgi:hypothetical protein